MILIDIINCWPKLIMIDLIWLVLAGIGGGILAGLLGIGGGIIYVLVLPYALTKAGIPSELLAQFIIANSIFGVLFASLASNILNLRNHDFYHKESLWVGLPGAFFSIVVLATIVSSSWYSITFFYVLLILFLLFMLISLYIKDSETNRKDLSKNKEVRLGMAGIIGGSLASLTGLGGGAAVVPILTTQLHLDIKMARSISLAMIFITSLALTVFNLFTFAGESSLPYQSGFIYFPVAIPLTIGVLMGSPIGNLLGRLFSSSTIKVLFSILIIVVIIEKLIYLL
jgi:uncharacterized membrane protein YfcA